MNSPQFQQAFAEYNRQASIDHSKFGCLLACTLMPAGSFTMDYFMYRGEMWPFFELRLLSAFFTGLVWVALSLPTGQKYHRVLAVAWYWIPMFFIACLIYRAQDPVSPYYAGFNLVLLAAGLVLPWMYREILLTVAMVLGVYLSIYFLSGAGRELHYLANNLFFLVSTGVIVATGSFLHSKARYREFCLRYELGQNRTALEGNNQKLLAQNERLELAIRQLKETESQLVQSEKLASLGRLSAGIIHEINNPLNFATTGLYTLRHQARHLAPAQQADYAEVLTDVEQGLARVQTIVSDLRTFTHPDNLSLDDFDLAQAVTASLRFASHEWKGRVDIRTQLPEGQLVRANKNRLIQVLLNLLQNSLDAFPRKTWAGERPAITITGRTEHGRTFILIHDNGPGIAPETVGKVFEPFFTTKDVGQGMGLGLSICHRLMQDMGGRITIRTEPGQFCEFTLELPGAAVEKT